MILRPLLARLKNLIRAIGSGSPVLVFVVGVAGAVAITWWRSSFGSLADGIRWGGTALELVGLGLVAYGLDQTRSRFGQPTLTARFRQWMTVVAASVRRPTVITGKATMDLGRVTATATASVTATLSDSSPEGRLAFVEQELRRLRQDVNAYRDRSEASFVEIRKSLDAEGTRNTERFSGLENRLQSLESFAAGGLVSEWIGFWWLLLGMLASNLSSELALLWTWSA